MNGSNPKIPVKMTMDYSDIAKTNYPFWFLREATKIQAVNDPDCAITAPCAKDSFDIRVIQHLLEVFGTFIIRPAKREIFFTNGVAYAYFKTPAFYLLYGWLDFLEGYISCRTSNADTIAVLEIGRDDGRLFI